MQIEHTILINFNNEFINLFNIVCTMSFHCIMLFGFFLFIFFSVVVDIDVVLFFILPITPSQKIPFNPHKMLISLGNFVGFCNTKYEDMKCFTKAKENKKKIHDKYFASTMPTTISKCYVKSLICSSTKRCAQCFKLQLKAHC